MEKTTKQPVKKGAQKNQGKKSEKNKTNKDIKNIETETKKVTKRKYTKDPNKLTQKEKKFIEAYLKHGNGTQASKDAGYNYKNDAVHGVNANRLLKIHKIHQAIDQANAEMHKETIATAQEVMEYFTKVMNGEILDQFGLEAPLSERTKAAQELAKRTVDWEARKAGKPDSVISVKLDFTGL